jgi:EpsI family protein
MTDASVAAGTPYPSGIYRVLPWLLLALALWVYRDLGASVLAEWINSNAYSHGLPSFGLALYLLWRDRAWLARPAPRTPWPVVLLAAVIATGLWLASATQVQTARQFGGWLLLVCVCFALYRRVGLREMAFPLLVILLVLPVWDFLQQPLRDLSTVASVFLVKLTAIPVYQEGYRVTVPGGAFVIEPACSGLSFFLCSVLLSFFFIRVNRLRGYRALGFLAFGMALAILANWIRIATIIMVGNYTRMDHFIVDDHLTFGWIVYSLMLIPFFLVGHWGFASEATVGATGPRTAARWSTGTTAGGAAPTWLLVLVLLLEPLVLAVLAGIPRSATEYELPAESATSSGAGAQSSLDWEVTYLGADSILQGRYLASGREYLVTVVNYLHQAQGKELVFVDNDLFEEGRWNLLARVRPAKTGDGFEYNLLAVSRNLSTQRLIGYWYVVQGRSTISPLTSKLLGLLGMLRGDTSASLIAVGVDFRPGDSEELEAELGGLIDQTRGRLQSRTRAIDGKTALQVSTDL